MGCFVHATLVPLQRGRGGRRHRASCQVTAKARQSVGSLEPRRKTAKLAVPSPNQTKPNPHPVASKRFLRKSFLRGSLRHIQIRTHTARWNTSSIAKQPPGSLFVLYQTFSIYCYSCIYPQFHPISNKNLYMTPPLLLRSLLYLRDAANLMRLPSRYKAWRMWCDGRRDGLLMAAP